MYFLFTTSGGRPTVANLNTLAAAAATAWGTNCKSLYSSNGVLATVTCQDITDTTGAFGQSSPGTAGTRAGSQPTTFACANVAYGINQHYRGGKPKGFWPFGIQSDTTNESDWVGAFTAAVNTGVAALSAAITGSTAGTITVGAQQAVSFFKGAQNNPAPGAFKRRNIPLPRATAVLYPVTAWTTAPKIASQRRRRI